MNWTKLVRLIITLFMKYIQPFFASKEPHRLCFARTRPTGAYERATPCDEDEKIISESLM